MADRGRLVVCATPIGNLGDVSDRLRQTLREADVVYAEDTRRAAILLQHVGATPSVFSLFVGNEAERVADVLSELDQGKVVALITDAGTPAVSDPGAGAVSEARRAGHQVTVVPGPSAVTAALALAGFGADRFVFEGFLPKRGKERKERIAGAALETRPVVLFVSPHRFLADLEALADATGPERIVAITRELTKLHEETWVGEIGHALEEWAGREAKGEFTIVLGPGEEPKVSVDEAIDEARALVAAGAPLSEAARRVAEGTGVSRRRIYEMLLADQERS